MHSDIVVVNFARMPKRNLNTLIEATAEDIYHSLQHKSFGELAVSAIIYDKSQHEYGYVFAGIPNTYNRFMRAYLQQHSLRFDKLIADSSSTFQPDLNHHINGNMYVIQSRLIIPIIISAGKHILTYSIIICSSKQNSFNQKTQKSIRRLIYSKLNIRSQQQQIIHQAILSLNEMASAGEDEILRALRGYVQQIVFKIRPGKMMCYVGLLKYNSIQTETNITRETQIVFPRTVNEDILNEHDGILFDGTQHTIYLSPPHMRPKRIGIIGRTIEGRLEGGSRAFFSQNIGDVQKDADFIRLFNKGFNTRSQLCVPIHIKHQILGAVCVEHQDKKAFDDNTILAIEILANATFFALQSARLYHTLQQLSQFIHDNALDDSQLFANILQSCCLLIGAEFGGLGIINQAGDIDYRITVGVKPIFIDHKEKSYSTYLLDKKLSYLYIPDLQDAQDPRIEYMNEMGYRYRRNNDYLQTRSELFVPIILHTQAGVGTPIAIINLQSLEKDGFSQNTIDIVQTFARQVAYIIRNIRFASNLRKLNGFAKTHWRLSDDEL